MDDRFKPTDDFGTSPNIARFPCGSMRRVGRTCSEEANEKTRKQPNRRDSKRSAWSGARSDRPQYAGMEPWSRGGSVCRDLFHVFPDLIFSAFNMQRGKLTFSARLNVSEISISKTVGGLDGLLFKGRQNTPRRKPIHCRLLGEYKIGAG
jgi:hypothetical protein